MLTAESIVAKVVIFIVQKTIGKIVSLPFDKRRKACRSLTKLYYCVQSLDDVTESFLHTFDEFRRSGKADVLVNALNNHSHDVELATNMFIDLSQELEPGLELIDPALALCCHALYRGKGDFLNFMSNSIHWERSGQRPRIVLKRPLGRMELADMESMYNLSNQAIAAGEKHYWPTSVFDEFSKDFEEISVGFEDEFVATELYEMIFQQNRLLKTAKEALRTLIKESFSIEEVLFQSDSHPYR